MPHSRLISPLPGTVAIFDVHEALVDRALPEARAFAAQLAGPRRRQFLAGRGAAAGALMTLTRQGAEVPRAQTGAPVWPTGVVGSIAHDAEHAVAVVGWQREWLALGIDVEPDLGLSEDAADIVLSDLERAAVGAPGEPLRYGRLVFGAKECVHKAMHPLRNVWLDFEEVAIGISDPSHQEGHWTLRALSDSARAAFAGLAFTGRWQRHNGTLVSYLGVRAAT